MASPGNRHCANCIGTLSFAIVVCVTGWTVMWQNSTAVHVTVLVQKSTNKKYRRSLQQPKFIEKCVEAVWMSAHKMWAFSTNFVKKFETTVVANGAVQMPHLKCEVLLFIQSGSRNPGDNTVQKTKVVAIRTLSVATEYHHTT